MLDFPIVHLASFFGEFRADIVSVLGEVVAQLLQFGAQFLLLRRHHCHGCRRGGARWCVGLRHCSLYRRNFFCPRGQAWRHDRFFHLGRMALRAGHEPPPGLLVTGSGVLEPALALVAPLANERVTDPSALRRTCRSAGSAMGSTISKRRPCCNDGIRARALVTSAGSISAMTIPGSVPVSAMMRPHGSTISEWP